MIIQSSETTGNASTGNHLLESDFIIKCTVLEAIQCWSCFTINYIHVYWPRNIWLHNILGQKPTILISDWDES